MVADEGKIVNVNLLSSLFLQIQIEKKYPWGSTSVKKDAEIFVTVGIKIRGVP